MFKRKFARTIPDNLRAPHIKMWGFEAKRARKFTRTLPRTLPYFFHYHAFFFPELLPQPECDGKSSDVGGGGQIRIPIGGSWGPLIKSLSVIQQSLSLSQKTREGCGCLEDRNLLKLRSLDSSCPFFLSDTCIWGQWTQMLQML